LYIGCKGGGADLTAFSSTKPNLFLLPSLSTASYGLEKKSDIVDCLTAELEEPLPSSLLAVDSIVLEGSVLVHLIAPKPGISFGEYACSNFATYIRKQQFQADTQRIDLLFDIYTHDSL
jgi:hypothetical protein